MTDTRRLYNKAQQMVIPARSSANADESQTVRFLQMQTHNGAITQDDVPDLQFYGFSSSPLPGCDHVLLSLTGDPTGAHTVASNDQRHRPTYLKPGEVVVHDNAKNRLYFKDGVLVQIDALQSMIINAPTVTINASKGVIVNGNITVNGGIKSTKDIVAGTISLQNHKHTGVQTGGGISGKPI